MIDLVRRGLSAVCSSDEALTDVANTVLDIAAGGVVLPSLLVASVVAQWRSDWHRGGTSSDEQLTLRETEVLNAMTDGLSTKATARLLGLAVKTVENHKTRGSSPSWGCATRHTSLPKRLGAALVRAPYGRNRTTGDPLNPERCCIFPRHLIFDC